MSNELVEKTAKSVEWYTPRAVLSHVEEYFAATGFPDGIDLDPATSQDNPTRAGRARIRYCLGRIWPKVRHLARIRRARTPRRGRTWSLV